MRVIVIGATGTIGRFVVEALTPRHQVVPVSYRQCQIRVDLGDPSSIAEMYRTTGQVDAVISTAAAARSAPVAELTDEDFGQSLRNKLMGQVNLVRLGFDWLTDGGSFTLTSGGACPTPTCWRRVEKPCQCWCGGVRSGSSSRSAARDPSERGKPSVGRGDIRGPGYGSVGRYTCGRRCTSICAKSGRNAEWACT
jgi:hypothetical protein